MNLFSICFLLQSLLFSSLGEKSYSYVDCRRMPLDQKIIQRLDKKNGFFIEAGAFDGLNQSNTKRLEEYHGWTGILIEPSPSLFERLTVNRPHSRCFPCALGAFEQDNTTLMGDFDGSLMSSVDGVRRKCPPTETVPVRALQSILDEVNVHHVDFFSLDVEGYELNVLKGIDFHKTIFDFILIEIYRSSYDEIVEFMGSNGYDLIENFSGYNMQLNPGWDGTHNDYLFQRRANRS